MHFNYQSNCKIRALDYQPLIFVVDNDRDNLMFASYIIESMGMGFVEIQNSDLCLELVYKLLPDIVLLDIVMPKVNGLEIARAIVKDRGLAAISTIAVTGLTKTEDKNSLIDAGFDDYLCKPYLIEELEHKIYRLLQCPLPPV